MVVFYIHQHDCVAFIGWFNHNIPIFSYLIQSSLIIYSQIACFPSSPVQMFVGIQIRPDYLRDLFWQLGEKGGGSNLNYK